MVPLALRCINSNFEMGYIKMCGMWVIKIKTSNPQLLAAQLSEKILVLKSHETNDVLSICTKNGETVIPKIVELAQNAGVEIQSVVLQKPTLNDVFLHYTGREIRAAEPEHHLAPMEAARRRRIK